MAEAHTFFCRLLGPPLSPASYAVSFYIYVPATQREERLTREVRKTGGGGAKIRRQLRKRRPFYYIACKVVL